MTDRPHMIQWDEGGPFVAVSTEEIAPVIRRHAAHDGIAYFADCAECVAARARGDYPHWFPNGENA